MLAVVVGFGLRVYTLDGQSLWGDEAFTTFVIGQPWLRVLAPGLDTHPPFYYALLKAWAVLVAPPSGEMHSVFALRFLSVAASLPMIPLAYLAATWLFGRGAGTLAAWLMATAPVQVYYAQELRMYALAAMLSVASIALLIALLQGRASRGWVVGYALVTLAGLYTHYGVFFVLPAQFLAALTLALARRRRGARDWSPLTPWLWTMALVALAYAPWVIGQASSLAGHARAADRSLGLTALADITWRGLVSYTAGLTLPGLAPLAVVVGAALAGVGVVTLARQRAAWEAVLLGAAIVSPLLLGWLANALMPFFHERFVLMGAAPLVVAAGIGVAGLLQRQRTLAGLGLGVLLALNVVSLRHWYSDPQFVKSDYGPVIQGLMAQVGAHDVVLLNNSEQQALFDFYVPRRAPGSVVTLSNDDVLTGATAERALAQATLGRDRAWLVSFGDPAVYDPERDAEAWLAGHGFRSAFQSHRGFEVARYELTAALPTTPSQPADVAFADGIRLGGVDVRPDPAQPGGALLVSLFWRPETTPAARYTVFSHLIDADGKLVAQFDGEPAGGTAPTTTWQPGATVVDRRAIPLPVDLPPGRYTLRVGMYSQPGLQRLAVAAAPGPVVDNAAQVAEVTVSP
ncbi:MAG: glycosyltransferase family 39 protein [Anaerolineae bacterium]|nr:glycosyltransferase family 39 protein [Anaerolineae bacterium]